MRRRNQVRRPQRSRVNRRITSVQNSVKGQSLRLSPDPPAFAQIPWHPITLSDNVTFAALINTKSYTATSICNIFKAQTGCTQANDKLSFRLLQSSVWELSGKKVTLEILDLTLGLGANDFLAQLEDVPGRNQWARVGYKYPVSQNLVAFSGNDTEPVVVVTADNGSTICARFHVLWRFRYGTLPNLKQQVASRLCSLEQQLQELRLLASYETLETEATPSLNSRKCTTATPSTLRIGHPSSDQVDRTQDDLQN